MSTLSRRSVLSAAAAASAAALSGISAASADTMNMNMGQAPATTGKDSTVAPGVTMRVYNERPAIIPGFKTVRLVDFVFAPGAKFTSTDPMPSPMVCHITEGALRLVQNGKEFSAKPFDVWTCDKTTTEQAYNDGTVPAVMRMTWLLT